MPAITFIVVIHKILMVMFLDAVCYSFTYPLALPFAISLIEEYVFSQFSTIIQEMSSLHYS